MTALLSTLFSLAFVALLWVVPIALGVREAKRKGISPHWMWFGVYPILGWIPYLILKFKAKARPRCTSCSTILPLTANYCPACRQPRGHAETAHLPPALQHRSAVTATGLVRWGRGRAQCPNCLQFVPLAANYCPSCGDPAARFACQSCHRRNTALFRPRAALIIGILLVLLGGLAGDLAQKKLSGSRYAYPASSSDEATYLQVGAVMAYLVGAAAIWLYLSRHAWRLRCADCRVTGPVSSLADGQQTTQ